MCGLGGANNFRCRSDHMGEQMTDISKCDGHEHARICKTCWRKLAPADPTRQSYMAGRISEDWKSCENYWDARSKSQVKRLKVQTKK